MSARVSSTPASASPRASRSPTWPSPTTATVRPARSTVPKARWHAARIAACTPAAVNGLGSPAPPRSTGMPVTWVVRVAISTMSSVAVPTSSAVM